MLAGDVFLSVNRFERKKGIELAISSLHEVIHRHALSSGACARCRLIVCGGYDPRVAENVQYYLELRELAESLGVEDRVVFLKNVTETDRYVHQYFFSSGHFGLVTPKTTCFRYLKKCFSHESIQKMYCITLKTECSVLPGAARTRGELRCRGPGRLPEERDRD